METKFKINSGVQELTLEDVMHRLECIEALLQSFLRTTRDIMNSEEVAAWLGISRSTLYKLTMNHAIPFYKLPASNLNVYDRKEVEAWLRTQKGVPYKTEEEIREMADAYMLATTR